MSEKVSGIYAKDGSPFDYPLTEVIAKRWQRLGELSIEEAAFVVAGFEPPPIEVIRFKPIRYQERPGKTWARPPNYDDFVLAAERALQRNQIGGRSSIQKMYTVRLVELPTILQWARKQEFTIASEWEQFEEDVARTGNGSEVLPTPRLMPMAQPEATTVVTQAAPVVDTTEITPDPPRRLARLRALGGAAKYRNCEWKFTGIAALVELEKNEGRKRCDEKTIRADLKEAAKDELDAKRAGTFTGLGQR